ncbi:MAG: hypothetical protein RL754_1301 [Bacteroidota bacterium]|jgi:beta-glucanase (GH16 family)
MRKLLSIVLFTALASSSHAQTFDTLVWSDEFNSAGAIDSNLWFAQHQLPISGSWYNGEIQHYTNRDTNAYSDGSVLRLSAYKETFTDQGHTKDYTSARLNSKFAFTYGRVEFRAQLPSGIGTWPALWMLGQNIIETGAYWQTQGYGTQPWPNCGEIDIMEHWGHNQDYVSSAIHSPSSYGGTINVGGQYIDSTSTAFHIYAMEWTPTSITFSVDSTVHYTYEPSVQDASTWPFDNPQYLLMNIAILPTIDTSITKAEMLIDYVRVYQSSTMSTDELEAASIELYPNPASNELHIHQPYGKAEAALWNLNGQCILRWNLNDFRSTTDVSNLPAGTYTLEITSGNKTAQQRVVIQ